MQPMPAKPRLGQNFLCDAQAIDRIAASLGDLNGRTVVEIGPGAGAITGALAARAAHVIARRIASVLKHTMLAPDIKHGGIETAVTLATLKPSDNVDSLIARVVGQVAGG